MFTDSDYELFKVLIWNFISIFDFHLFILKLLVAKGAQPQIFQGRGGLVGLGHFINILLKTPEKKCAAGKNLGVFSPRYP